MIVSEIHTHLNFYDFDRKFINSNRKYNIIAVEAETILNKKLTFDIINEKYNKMILIAE